MIIVILGAIFIGLILGLMGAGGSILTIPLFTYGAGLDPKTAITTSLLTVGATSLISVFPYLKRKHVHFPTSFIFLALGIPFSFVGSQIAVWINGHVQLLIFSGILFLAGWQMVREKSPKVADESRWKIYMVAAIVGFLTGLLGVGGGFLLIPALTIYLHFPMEKSVGNSLFIIGFNAMAGFVSTQGHHPPDWNVAILFTAIAVVASFSSAVYSKKVNPMHLMKAFAVLVFAVAIYILIRESMFIYSWYQIS